MGLTDNERLQNIYVVLNQVSNIITEFHRRKKINVDITVDQNVEDLLALCDKLWPAFLGSPEKSWHWLTGSEGCENTITSDPVSPWEVAVQQHLEVAYEKAKNEPEEEVVCEFEKHKDMLVSFEIPRLLEYVKQYDLALTFKIYRKMEALVYYLRRYDDDFVVKHTTLNDLLNQIFGACFGIFKEPQNTCFAKAYCIREYFRMLFGSVYGDKDNKYDVVHEILFENQIYFSKKIAECMHEPLKESVILPILMIYSRTADNIKKTQNDLHERMRSLMLFVDKEMFKKIKEKIKESVLADNLKEYKKIVKENVEITEKSRVSDNYFFKEVHAFGHDAYFDLREKLEEN